MTTLDDRDDQPDRQTARKMKDDLTSPNDTTRREASCPDDVVRPLDKLPFVPPKLETEPFHRDSLAGAAPIEVQPADNEPDKSFSKTDRLDESRRSRREVLRRGGTLAFAVPIISTFFASQAYAANYSCYAEGHACVGAEPCCGDLACNEGVCSEFCVSAGGQCFTNADCCSSDCRVDTCQ